ncbi:sensor histidine kinase [Peribacillus kribbensis]|uniref:sensor histidine kinase n=1 Tax=Peribacillus kribbensis TaxID=356658 RepID=UPI00047D5D5B|nr:ATP-binding protein [Peribacillus kribbensis]
MRSAIEKGRISLYSRLSHQQLLVEIRNTGGGIAPDVLPHIWERFYTEESSRSSHRERSGLSLAITRQLVGLMGGSIEAASTSEEAIFTFQIPVKTDKLPHP